MIGIKELEQGLYDGQLRLFGHVPEILAVPSTDKRVSKGHFYSLMNDGSSIIYQQKQPKRPKTPQEAEQEIEYLKQYGSAFVGASGGTVAGLSYALTNGATLYSTAALGLAGGIVGAGVLGLIGLGAYYLFFRGRRKTDPKHSLVRKRSALYWLLDWLEEEWKKGSQPRQALMPAYATA